MRILPTPHGMRTKEIAMNAVVTSRSRWALVDDDSHSARLLLRSLFDHSAPRTRWLGDGRRALRSLAEVGGEEGWPELIIVDLKSRSSATRDFIAHIRMAASENGSTIIAMAPSLERDLRESLLEAGAAAVFERHGDINAYRREAAGIINFWARNQRLERVGA